MTPWINVLPDQGAPPLDPHPIPMASVSIWHLSHPVIFINCNIGNFSDYRHIPELDVYDQDNLDDSEYSMMSEGDRAAAEGAMRKRDRDEGLITGRMRRGLLYGKSNQWYIVWVIGSIGCNWKETFLSLQLLEYSSQYWEFLMYLCKLHELYCIKHLAHGGNAFDQMRAMMRKIDQPENGAWQKEPQKEMLQRTRRW